MNMVLKLVLFLGLALVLIQVWKLLNWLWFKPRKIEKLLRKQGLKGNSYKFLFGDAMEFKDMLIEAKSKPINLSDDIVPRVLPFDLKSLNTYGKHFFIWLGPDALVYIMEPDLVKEVFSKFYQFQKPVLSNPLTRLLLSGLIVYEGDKWVKHRKIVNPAFHAEKLKNMLPAFFLSCSEMISKWERMMSIDGSCELDVWPYLQTFTADVISHTAFGSSYQEGSRIFELQTKLGELVIQAAQSFYIPGSRFFPSKKSKLMKGMDKEINDLIRRIVNKRLIAIERGEASDEDLLGILLECNRKEIEQHGNKKFGMTIEEVIAECRLFYLGGQETASSFLVWILVLLAMHPSWQSKAREEVFQLFGTGKPDIDGLNRMKIVNMILLEVLRLYPPVPTIRRIVHEETKLGEISVPAGTQIVLPIMLLHHDRKLWGDDADEFKPERFSKGVSEARKGQVAFFPFSWGPRICIGQNFAIVEAKMALTMILQRFSFTLSPSYSHAPYAIITVCPQNGAHITLKKL